MHVAFKCTYNNGGEGVYVGFNGVCSENIIKHNIESKRVYCSIENGLCHKYMASGFTSSKPIDPCYESTLFKDWIFGAGYSHTGSGGSKPFSMHNVNEGDLAILTTRFPNTSEEERNIIGLFQIAKVRNVPETTIYAEDLVKIKLPVDIARKLYFWDYYNNTTDRCFWGSGLFRYIDNQTVLRVLSDVRDVLREDDIRIEINRLITCYKDEEDIPEAQGYRILKGEMNLNERIMDQRKYGYGGEGENHKKLKEWVADNPEFLGLSTDSNVEVEKHIFPSGDRPDIVFESAEKSCVVEIETDTVLPGAFQAIKYRALLCAEKGLQQEANSITSYLVAWHIPREIKMFCDKYGILYKEKKL